MSSTTQGNSSAYLTARLKRDAPELAAKVIAGEMTAKAAAREAGIVQKSHTIPHHPRRAAAAILRHFDDDEAMEIYQILHRELFKGETV